MTTYACVDIGGTMIKHGLVNQDGQILEKAQQPTKAYTSKLARKASPKFSRKNNPHLCETSK